MEINIEQLTRSWFFIGVCYCSILTWYYWYFTRKYPNFFISKGNNELKKQFSSNVVRSFVGITMWVFGVGIIISEQLSTWLPLSLILLYMLWTLISIYKSKH